MTQLGSCSFIHNSIIKQMGAQRERSLSQQKDPRKKHSKLNHGVDNCRCCTSQEYSRGHMNSSWPQKLFLQKGNSSLKHCNPISAILWYRLYRYLCLQKPVRLVMWCVHLMYTHKKVTHLLTMKGIRAIMQECNLKPQDVTEGSPGVSYRNHKDGRLCVKHRFLAEINPIPNISITCYLGNT